MPWKSAPRIHLYRTHETWDLLPRCTLHGEVSREVPWIRWVAVIGGALLLAVVDGELGVSHAILAGVAVYTAVFQLIGSRRVPVSVSGALDVVAILLVVAARGPLETQAHLFLVLPLLVLSVAYGGAGAFAVTASSVLGYGGLLILAADDLLAPVVVVRWATLGFFVVVGAAAGYTVHRYEVLVRELLHQSVTDPLTGLFNRRYFSGALERARRLALRQDEPYALILIDVKGFKAINDRQGHDVGDQVLLRLADHFLRKVRLQDVVARIGGDEFAVVLPVTDLEGALAGARRLVRHLDETDSILSSISLSVGVARGRSDEGGAEATFVAADRALLEAKRERGSAVKVEEAERVREGPRTGTGGSP